MPPDTKTVRLGAVFVDTILSDTELIRSLLTTTCQPILTLNFTTKQFLSRHVFTLLPLPGFIIEFYILAQMTFWS